MSRLQNFKKLAIALVVVFSAAALIVPATSLAASVSTPGMPETSAGSVKDAKKDALVLGKDMFSAGENVNLNNPEVYSNLFAAGNVVTVSGGKIAADAFVAGKSVELDQTMVGSNVYAAGESVKCSAIVTGLVFLAGSDVRLSGQAVSASVAGNTVSIDGSFSGDVNASGDSIVIGPNTVIDGTLYVQSSTEPTIPTSAKIANYKFTKSQQNSIGIGSIGIAEGIAAAVTGFLMMLVIASIVGIIVSALIALLLATDRPFVAAGNELRARPARVLLTGFLVILLVPIAVVILFVTFIGWKIALTLLLVCVVLSMLSDVFAAISVGFMVFKKMNRWGAAVLMSLIFAIVGAIPIVGWLLSLFCSMFMVGYVCTYYFDWRRARKVQSNRGAPVLNAAQGAPQGAVYGAPQDAVYGAPQDAAYGAPQDPAQGAMQAAPQDAAQGEDAKPVPPTA